MSVRVSNLSLAYDGRAVLSDLSFAAEKGSLVCVLGANGAGKSTLFRCLLGLESGYTGRIEVGGRDIREENTALRARKIAYVPQFQEVAFPYVAHTLVLMGTTARLGRYASPGAAEERAANEALNRLGIAHLAHRSIEHMSGGEVQLVCIARALAQQANVLVMDEPTANLDYGNQARVMRIVTGLARGGYTIIQSTHNPEQAMLYADRVIALHRGEIVGDGAPKDVMDAALMETLYGIGVRSVDLEEERIRVFIPETRACP